MKARVERTIDQRTTMLAGVSHDLRTVLTRFKLELALIGYSPEAEAMKRSTASSCWTRISTLLDWPTVSIQNGRFRC
jgi:two-component system osmolarity sensor histidine kinase EnvZ